MSNRACSAARLGRIVVLSALLFASATASAGDPTAVAPDSTSAPTPALPTVCVIVHDAAMSATRQANDAPKTGEQTLRGCARLVRTSQELNGSGDLSVGVDRTALAAFQAAKQNQPGTFVLFLNGVAMPTDARLIAREAVDDLMVFRYRINQGKESQLLWSMLYADGHLFDSGPLRAVLGWMATGDASQTFIPESRSPVTPNTVATVKVTTLGQLLIAGGLVLITCGVVVYIGRFTDGLRDGGLPPWWSKAQLLRAGIRKMSAANRDRYIAGIYNWYQAGSIDKYVAGANMVLKGKPVASTQEEEEAIVGLALRGRNWKPRRATYSLSRTQMALWFAFTVGAGLFLWVIYGDLRRIDNSLLILLGISIGTAGFGWMVDRDIEERTYEPSQGFLADLLTGFDDRRQIHRYQAVVVNLLLLVVGVFHVAQQLSYPVFDATWLIFLGISGAAYGTGKGLVETNDAKP